MQTKMKMTCGWCGKQFDLIVSEFNRQVSRGRTIFFCGLSCAGFYAARISGRKTIPIEKICPNCGKKFQSSTAKKAATFCSRGCASAGSVSYLRREKAKKMGKRNADIAGFGSAKVTANSLRSREGWKYVMLEKFLTERGEPHCFEFPIGEFVFDLCLPRLDLIIEFDGQYHNDRNQKSVDMVRDKTARQRGWKIVRIVVKDKAIIRPDVLFDLLK